jgi:hypothetical protein
VKEKVVRAGFRFAFYLCALTVAVLAFYPLEAVPLTGDDKANHIVAFAVLSWLADVAYSGPARVLASWAFGLLVFGLFIEITQRFLPYRHFSWLDLGADALGIVLYIVVSRIFLAVVPRASLRRQRKAG